ncbi:LysR family transcriptional regulator [Tamaricihabitans halophyticus]|uniref:LysR family transcriptional regulator n=1 Tax=Tamaricihabitans halophyticus TaxID=1262583 RepID=UPI001A9D1AE0|nr:LysR family transcriptional regulator [Tamaricihabitans halophyticus]
MELQQLRYVLAVAETRNFTRAAENCFVVQSALSHQIKSLEQELGFQLFARTSRRVELTSAGAAFLPSARAALDAADRAVADSAAAVGQIRGTLSVGVIPTVTAVDIPAALGKFHRAHPAVPIRLRGGNSDAFINSITNGALDVAVLGLATSTPPEKVATEVLARERLVAVVSAKHRLASRRRLRLRDLADDTFVDFPEGSPGRTQSDLAFAAAGITRAVAFEAMGTELILDLVRQDLASTLLPPGLVTPSAELATIPLLDGPTRTQYLAWSSFNPTPAAAAFISLLKTDQRRSASSAGVGSDHS